MSAVLANRLIGSWSFVRDVRRVGGVERPSGWPDGATGRITYTPDGRMWVAIMGAHRKSFGGTEFRGGTQEEMAAAYAGYLGYCGTFRADDAAQVVEHHIDLASFPNWVGSIQRREVRFEDDLLILSPPPRMVNGEEVSPSIVWRRGSA